ncbi:hypothetical protein BESB_061340 [Besnoitia besnoiti]|uniref:Uncharacterized protein n=1 Tax=Besnoitia besnoiti TaxID=94643 RepID=A0A2A9MI27_BESBE|nr:hypothetical protein BESB_061340 [Besnoitia besnoiti]PFH35247.1 hypothetical protein BESB_061340 [Besnoitia besnoiti]
MHDLEDEDIFEEELILRKPKKRTWGRTFSTTTAKRGIWGQALKYSVAFVVGAAVLGATAKLGRAALAACECHQWTTAVARSYLSTETNAGAICGASRRQLVLAFLALLPEKPAGASRRQLVLAFLALLPEKPALFFPSDAIFDQLKAPRVGQGATVLSSPVLVSRVCSIGVQRQPDQAAPPSDSVPPIVFLPFLNATPNLDQLETVSVIPVPDLRWLTNYLPSGREVAGRLQRLLGRRQ